MESLRSLVGGKRGPSDEEIFVEEMRELIRPHVMTVLKEDFHIVEGEDQSALLIERLHERLLHRFFSFAKNDSSLNKFMFPIMLYLRKARNDRGKK